MKKKIIFITLLFLTIVSHSISLENNKLENKISKNLRCLVCQGQSVYDSQSDFAISMKILIKKKINEGKSEIEIYEFFRTQYGDWILYEPNLNKNTIFLWIFPIILFIFGGYLIFRNFFKK